LLNHSAGLPPLDAREALAAGLFEPWSARDDQVWPAWLRGIERFRAGVARVMNTEAALVCPQVSVSAALSQILGAVPMQPGRNRLVIAERAFPSLGFVFSMAERRGFELHMIPRECDTLDPATWAEHLDERVHAVLLTHVHSNTGECHDIARLAKLASAVGAISVVDVAQSIGIRPVDAMRWGVDFIVGSCIKWLCGGSGAGFLWVNSERLDSCQPIDVGWFSHADPFEFDIRHFEYAPDALRFWGGTPNVAPALVAAHSIAALLDVGLDRIEAHNRALGQRLIDGVPAVHLVSPIDAEHRGGSVILQFNEQQDAVAARLIDSGLKFDVRGEGLRVSPHLYNTDEDIGRVLDCLPG
jgi:selenocysteine lyase/cysteine desulfurase